MATIPAPVAPATPAPAPTRTTPPPAPAPTVPTTLSPVIRRPRPARTAPPARMAYTRHATAGNDDDRIVANALVTFYKVMAWGGGIAILIWILFGGFKWGRATAPVGVASSSVVYQQSALTPAPAIQPAPPRELTPEERAEQYKAERRRQYGIQ